MATPTNTPDSTSSPLARSLTVALVALAGLVFHLSPWGTRASFILLDGAFGVLRAVAPKPAPNDILVVGLGRGDAPRDGGAIDPMLRKLPDVLVRIAKGNPRAVALDVPLPGASLDAALPGYDDALATALSVTQAAAPLVVGLSVDARREVMPIHERFLRGVDPRAFAFTLLLRDEDGGVRRIGLGLPTQQGQWPTLSGWLCEVLRGRCQDGLIDYALGPAYGLVSSKGLLEVRDDADLVRLFQGKVVFVAPVGREQDRLPLPVALADWMPSAAESPAVLAHAQTLRTLMHGEPVREAPLPVMLLVIALVALVARVSSPVAPATAVLALGGGVAAALLFLRLGYYAPLAAPLATLAFALLASRRLR